MEQIADESGQQPLVVVGPQAALGLALVTGNPRTGTQLSVSLTDTRLGCGTLCQRARGVIKAHFVRLVPGEGRDESGRFCAEGQNKRI